MDVKTRFKDLCHELNMDKETEESAWNNYINTSQRFTLEGDQSLWLCCALFEACRESYRPTVGGINEVVKGNCVSLTKLLRCCNVSIFDFFKKVEFWCEMTNVSFTQIKRLEQGFKMTLNLFQWYHKIFYQIFVEILNEKKNKKSRPMKCSQSKLYELCWCLFLCAKNENLNGTIDLVSSVHLLLCCIDLVYVNALAENRVDLISSNFEGVPKKWNTSEFNASNVHNHCIIEALCKLTNGVYTEAKSMKIHSWKQIMNKFIETKILHGNKETFMDIISNNNFEPNLKSLNSSYAQFVLSVGAFDERIVLHNTNFRKSGNSESGGNNAYINQCVSSIAPETPLTRKHHLPSKDYTLEPVASATQSVKKLQAIAHITEPSDYIKKVGESTVQSFISILNTKEAAFKNKYPIEAEGETRFALVRSLYFHLLEEIVRAEVITKPNIDIKVLLETETLHSVLITCCVEIVLDAYNSQLKFPWVLGCFGVEPFYFIKIIEIVVKRQKILTRNLIKHLNHIEETCLESMTWNSASPFWEILERRKTPLPQWSEVDVNKMARCNKERNYLVSPTNSASDCFSTSSASTSESARRVLFNTEKVESKATDAPSRPSAADSKRDASLFIFLRKFYTLAWMRIKELCRELDMGDEKHIDKIWTLFEYSITQRTKLMQDRHLDQLLMCAMYIYVKVAEIPNKNFTDIMKLYRKQPQAASNIYREVLIKKNMENGEEKLENKDIIFFYNNIYVQEMSNYALKFSEKKRTEEYLLLSPHPTEKVNPPKRLSNHVYVQQLEKNEVQYAPNNIIYEFHKSPAKALDQMNEIVRNGKRNLTFDDDEREVVFKKIAKPNLHFQGRILDIKNDRQAERKE